MRYIIMLLVVIGLAIDITPLASSMRILAQVIFTAPKCAMEGLISSARLLL